MWLAHCDYLSLRIIEVLVIERFQEKDDGNGACRSQCGRLKPHSQLAVALSPAALSGPANRLGKRITLAGAFRQLRGPDGLRDTAAEELNELCPHENRPVDVIFTYVEAPEKLAPF